MIEGWALWLLLVGLAVGAAGAALVLLPLPRQDDDLGETERRTEATWIAATIEHHGGVAPESLVEEVLELHRAYLATPRVPAPPGASAPPLPAAEAMTRAPGFVPPPAAGSPGSPPATGPASETPAAGRPGPPQAPPQQSPPQQSSQAPPQQSPPQQPPPPPRQP